MSEHHDEQVTPARVYLDVDGVINAVTSRDPDAGWPDYTSVKVNGWPITYAPALIEVLNTVSHNPGVQVYWLTTWCHDAPQILAPALGIDGTDWPVVGYDHWRSSRGLPWWKHLAIVEHLADFQGGVLWIDDDHDVDPASIAWLSGQPQILAMRPNTRQGITRAQADLIERFAAEVPLRIRPDMPHTTATDDGATT